MERIDMLTPNELTAIAALTVELTRLRQNPVQHLCIENVGPEIFGKLVAEYLQQINVAGRESEAARLGRSVEHSPAQSKTANPVPAAPMHDSDCATNNAPAYPPGPCDCSLSKTT